eukprot:CAMPEP_0175289726 /NCGR_PEP_ID=MMETSP0093-20121207/55489_1 /TAXON_ID=311494 /ORGANISM="Alexandrium monilatum, Strain CCMP3105" /LENGTH=102 /DNA_ID=CAMNT_0016585355 /DNA_START=258 /DNA_END=566 /DNA_ORIENTATION=+
MSCGMWTTLGDSALTAWTRAACARSVGVEGGTLGGAVDAGVAGPEAEAAEACSGDPGSALLGPVSMDEASETSGRAARAGAAAAGATPAARASSPVSLAAGP